MSDTAIEAFDAEGEGASGADQTRQFVTFSLAGEMFAVPLAPVQEIIRVPTVARMPLAPPALDGLANLRGRVLPIVSLRRLFGIDEMPHDDATRALVIKLGQSLGFVVDRVSRVISVDPGEIAPADTIKSVVQTDYLTGVITREDAEGHRQLILVLDFDLLVRQQFSEVATRTTRATQSLGADGTLLRESSAVQHADDDLRLVSFLVADQEYAIDIASVQEIVQVPPSITSLPNTPRHVLGLMSLRQRLLPLVSLRTLFGLPPVAANEQHRIAVLALPGGSQVGLVTDAVKEVLSVPRAQADAMPAALTRDQELQELSSICRLDGGKRLVSVIDTDRLLGMQAVREALQVASDADGSGPVDRPGQEAAASSSDETQVVIFRLGAEEFGVPITSVHEIVRVPEALTRVPKTPRFVEGVINLRGAVLPVIDQRTRLGMNPIERNDGQRIMVYTLGKLQTGFIVDAVAEVLRIPLSQLAPAPDLSDEQSRLITQIARLDGDKRLVMVIDPAQLLGSGEISDMQHAVDTTAFETTAPAALPRAA
jgi:purine-binding chemotaxis protein CheW